MTQRKPGHVSWENWVEGQIKQDQNAGGFDNLPGAGKPLADIGELDQMAWLAKKLKRENIDPEFYLPPQLALAREIEDVHERLSGLPTESAVRSYLEDLNGRVRAMHAWPPEGPPVRAKLVDVDNLVDDWRRERDRRRAQAATAAAPPPPDVPRRWWRRSVRRSG